MTSFIKKLSTLLLALVFALFACSARSGKQQSALDGAVKALRKIEAATQVGVNYQQYGQLLIDAKAQVNESSAVLSEDKLKQDINWVMDAYADAGTVWGKKINGRHALYIIEDADKSLITKYALQTHEPSFGDTRQLEADLDQSMQRIWALATLRLNEIANNSKRGAN